MVDAVKHDRTQGQQIDSKGAPLNSGEIMAKKNAQPPKDVATQTEPNGTDKPLPRGSTSGSGAMHGGEAAKPGQMVHNEDSGPKD